MKELLMCLALVFALSSVWITSVSALEIRNEETVITDDWKVYEKGNVNGDDAVDIKDLVRLKKYFAGVCDEIVKTASDINGDEALDTNDLAALRGLLLAM